MRGGETMKKITWALLFLIVLMIPISAQAATPRVPKVLPGITFNGTTATCTTTVFGDNVDDSISLTAKLWKGSECIATWIDSGSGYLNFSRTMTVENGYMYKLTADVSINGKSLQTISTTGICG